MDLALTNANETKTFVLKDEVFLTQIKSENVFDNMTHLENFIFNYELKIEDSKNNLRFIKIIKKHFRTTLKVNKIH